MDAGSAETSAGLPVASATSEAAAMLSGAPGIRRLLLVLQSVAIGGMETMALDLGAEYARRGIAVRVAVPKGAAFDALEARATSFASVVRTNTDAREGHGTQVRSLWRFARLVREWRPDVVHLHTGGATGGLAAVALARAAGAGTVVITEHDVPVEHPGRGQRIARLAMDRLAGAVVAVSKRNAALRTERLRPPRRMASILNGVPQVEADGGTRRENRANVREMFGVGGEDVVLGSVVRLAEGKGLDDLLQAFAQMEAGRRARLLLVGDGSLHSELEAMAERLGIGKRVVFAGHQADPGRFLDAMDAFVLAVPAGSMSIALLEAMARGLPPVITFGGPEEAVIDGETGLTPPPRNPGALAAALEKLVGDAGLRERLGRAAAEHVARNFSVARVADDYLAVYDGAKRARVPERLRFEGRL